jgi:hypothetical protein
MFWVPAAVGWALLFHRAAAERTSAVVLGVGLGGVTIVALLRLEHRAHFRSRVRPLHYALAPMLGIEAKPRQWLDVPLDYATNNKAEIVLYVPKEFTGTDRDKEDIERAVTSRLPELEAPDFDWYRLDGMRPRVVVTHSEPPPSLVTWNQIAPKVDAKAAHELVTGIGKHNEVIKVSVETDSPHFGISMGTGAGKSNLAAFWLVQRLRQGDIALILDAKHFSHPWAFKDMDAEYGLLPNVRYARWIPDLHDAMMWLGQELSSRTLAAERVIKQHWADVRDKEQVKKSPALTAFGGVAFAGRAVKMHLIVIGQQLTAETLGGGSVRENIGVRCLARYTQNSWKMQAGDVPMPPSPSVPGRVQCIASGGVSETQVPLMDLEQVRELAIGGDVTNCPAEMPGGATPAELLVPAPTSIRMGADVPFVLGMTLAQGIAEGVLRRSKESARKEAQRPGFPEPLNPDDGPGVAKRYRPSDLAAWEDR